LREYFLSLAELREFRGFSELFLISLMT